MPTVAEWLVFLGGTAVFAVLPGPGTRRVLARALRVGRSAGCRFAVAKAMSALVPVTAVSFVLPGRPLVFLLLGLIVVAMTLAVDIAVAMTAGVLAMPGREQRPRTVARVAPIGAGGALSPVLAAVLHNASSVAVVANSSRLIRFEIDRTPK